MKTYNFALQNNFRVETDDSTKLSASVKVYVSGRKNLRKMSVRGEMMNELGIATPIINECFLSVDSERNIADSVESLVNSCAVHRFGYQMEEFNRRLHVIRSN